MKTLMKEALISIVAAFAAVVFMMYYLDIWPKKNSGEYVKYALFLIIIVGGRAIISHLRRRRHEDSDDEKPGK
jgi:hypothetical protein